MMTFQSMGNITPEYLTGSVLNLLGERGCLFSPLLHKTVSATILHASEKVNVIPSVASMEMDGRLLPGYTHDDVQAVLIATLLHRRPHTRLVDW